MSKALNIILKILAALCVIAFVFAAGLSLLLFNAERKLFDAQAYLRALEMQNVFERVPSLVADVAASNQADVAPPYLQFLSASDWEKIVAAVVPPDITRAVTRRTVVSFFDFLDGKSERAVVPLTEVKSFVAGPQGLEAVEHLLASQPACTSEQLAEMILLDLDSNEGRFYLCLPPDEFANGRIKYVLQAVIEDSLQEVTQRVPDQIVLLDAQNEAQAKFVSSLRLARLAMRLSPFLPLGLLLLVALFAVRSLRGWLGWWGASLFLGGVFGLIVAAAVHPIFQWAYQSQILPRLPIVPPEALTETARELIASLLTDVAAPIAIQSTLILLAGIVMLLATRWPRRQPVPPAPQPPAQPADALAQPQAPEGEITHDKS